MANAKKKMTKEVVVEKEVFIEKKPDVDTEEKDT